MVALEAGDLERLRRSSRRAALASAAGALLVFGALAAGSVQLRQQRSQARELAADVEELEARRGELAEEIASLERQWQVASQQIQEQQSFARTLSASAERRAPIMVVAQPRASATPLGNDRYDFRIWLELPPDRHEECEKVSYFFNHPTFTQQTLESRDADTNWAVEYHGWGALDRVLVTMHLRDGSEQTIAFNMLAALRGEGRVPGAGSAPGSGKESPVRGIPGKQRPSKKSPPA